MFASAARRVQPFMLVHGKLISEELVPLELRFVNTITWGKSAVINSAAGCHTIHLVHSQYLGFICTKALAYLVMH